MTYHDILSYKLNTSFFVAKVRNYGIFITCLSIAFEDLLTSPIAPQVVPPCRKWQGQKQPKKEMMRLWWKYNDSTCSFFSRKKLSPIYEILSEDFSALKVCWLKKWQVHCIAGMIGFWKCILWRSNFWEESG